MKINKINAKKGTRMIVVNTDMTAWILCGWTFIRRYNTGYVVLEKIN